jgi:type I restriction enzyme R subunit
VHSNPQSARIEFEDALRGVMVDLLSDQTELFKLYSDDDNFRKWLSDTVFWLTYRPEDMVADVETA